MVDRYLVSVWGLQGFPEEHTILFLSKGLTSNLIGLTDCHLPIINSND